MQVESFNANSPLQPLRVCEYLLYFETQSTFISYKKPLSNHFTMHAQTQIQPFGNRPVLIKRAIIGAVINFLLISLFLAGADYRDPSWPALWFIRPLIIVPFAGAVGGIVFHLKDYIAQQLEWNKHVVTVLCLIIYVVGLWMGFVLGLDGTYWD